MSQYVPDQGDIVWVDFDPSAGKEIMKRRPAYVVSRAVLNDHTGLAIVAPITSTVKGIALEVSLDDDMETSGVVLPYQLKALDYKSRNFRLIEKASSDVIEEVQNKVKLIVQ